MPECAEIKIMTEYINDCTEGYTFTSMEKSKETKVPCKVWGRGIWPFEIKATHRGKEMILDMGTDKLKASMGMSGHWRLTTKADMYKHTHLWFERDDGMILGLVDVRRFAKWSWCFDWGAKRGPCIMTEPEEFDKHIQNNLHKKKFQKPICEVIMDQSYFNGVGNYLRAEILDRIDCSPFMAAREYIINNPQLTTVVYEVVWESYLAGGGELKDWNNPYTTGYARGRINKKMKVKSYSSFRDWLQCYQKKANVIDGTKRRFWFDQKFLQKDFEVSK